MIALTRLGPAIPAHGPPEVSRPAGHAGRLPVRITAADNSVIPWPLIWAMWSSPDTTGPLSGGAGSLTLPMSAFEKFEGSGSEIATLEAMSAERGRACWSIGDSPCTTEFELVETPLVWPIVPEELFTLPPSFLAAMHEAGRTAAREEGKYAFDGVQIRGKAGQLIATDGKQALIQGGFKFPFAEDLIVPAVPLFGAKELAGEEAVNIDRIDNWLFVEIGFWHIWLQIDPEKRFPDVVGAIPRATGTHLKFHDEDAQKVLEVLPQLLRVTGDDVQSVTLDLGRSVAIRVPGGIGCEIVEVLCGKVNPMALVQVALNRAPSWPGPGPGIPEFRCASPERPWSRWTVRACTLFAARSQFGRAVGEVSSRETSGAITDRRSEIPNRPSPDSAHYSRTTAMPARESPPRNAMATRKPMATAWVIRWSKPKRCELPWPKPRPRPDDSFLRSRDSASSTRP